MSVEVVRSYIRGVSEYVNVKIHLDTSGKLNFSFPHDHYIG